MGAQGLLDEATEAIIAPLMTQLEKVTGDPAELRGKARLWQRTAQTVRQTAAATRDDVSDLRASWRGAAADAFSAEMSEHDATFVAMARDMEATASCLSQAADECEQAENMIRELVKELIEAIAVASCLSMVTSVLTVGASAVVGALADAAEAAQFVGRAGELVDKLAAFLRRATDLLADLRKAQRAVRAAERRNRKPRLPHESARRRGPDARRSSRRTHSGRHGEHHSERNDERGGEPRGDHRHSDPAGHPPARHVRHGPTHGQRIAVSGAEQLAQQLLGLDDDGYDSLAQTAAGDAGVALDIDPNQGFADALAPSQPPAGQPPADQPPADQPPADQRPAITLDTALLNAGGQDRPTLDLPTRTVD